MGTSFDNQKLEVQRPDEGLEGEILDNDNNFLICASFYFYIFLEKSVFCYINFFLLPHGLILFKILEDDQRKRTRQAQDLFPPRGGKGGDIVYWIWPPVAILPSEAGDGLEEQYSNFT